MSGKTSVPSRSTLTLDNVNGDLEIGRHAVVKGSSSQPKVTVSGTVHCEETIRLNAASLRKTSKPRAV